MNTFAARATLIVSVACLSARCFAQAPDPLDSWAMRYVNAFFLADVTYGADAFVALGNQIYTSNDGVCWTKRPLDPPLSEPRGGLTYGNGKFVAVGQGAAYGSTDAVSWQRTASLPDDIQKVTFGGGTFLAVGQEYHPRRSSGTHWLVMHSADGVNWTRQSGPTNENENYYLDAAAYGNGRFVVGGWTFQSQPLVLTSTNLVDWETVPDFPFLVVRGITYADGMFVAVGSSVATSADGRTWTERPPAVASGFEAITFGQDTFVAAASDGILWSAPDAVDWTQHATGVDSIRAVTYGKGSFVGVGGFYTDMPREVAVQSGGRPQVCLEALGFGSGADPGFHLQLTVEAGRTYQLQSTSVLPADSWTDVSRFTLPPDPLPFPVRLVDPTASRIDQRFYRLLVP